MSLLGSLKIKGKVLYNEPLCKHTTFKIGGPAKAWAGAEDIDDLTALLEISKSEGVPIFLIGEGSNLLASDGSLDLIIVSLKGAFNFSKIDKDNIVVGAGSGLQGFILKTLEQCYSGLEFMAGIPGTVGGAISMNAGAGLKGPWISKFVTRLKTIDRAGNLRDIEVKDLKFEYRESHLKGLIILEAEFNLKKSKDKRVLLNVYKRFLTEKKNKQELAMPSAGCVFKNPPGYGLSAARLIEGCGLKGERIGDAMVSTKHANFIINAGKATFKDVMGLIDIIKEKVLEKHKILLETEIEIIGQ